MPLEKNRRQSRRESAKISLNFSVLVRKMSFIEREQSIRFVLVEPSHPGNIGSAARAIKTMGFSRLYVVNPQNLGYKLDSQAIGFSTHAVDVLESSVMTQNLSEALETVDFAFALSGYDHEFGPPFVSLVEAANKARALVEARKDIEIAFVFGTERSGLTNEQIQLCQACAAIPANPECDSLNLSQAVQVVAYQLQNALRGDTVDPYALRFEEETPAGPQAVELFFEHLQKALVSCGALNPDQPKFMMQRLYRLFSRAGLSVNDIDMLRGICAAVIQPKKERKGTKC